MGILVIGAGPAGCAIAVGLAARGHVVTLIHRPDPAPRVEGFSLRTLEALRRVGLHGAAACASPPVEREVHWGGWQGAVNREHLVERDRFDRALLADARAAGIASASGRIERLRFRDDGWRLSLSDRSGASREYSAEWLIDARGRAAPRAGRGPRGVPTLAVSRRFESGARASGAVLGTWEEGFAWACWHAGRGVLQLFVDPGRRWRNPLEEPFEAAVECLQREAPAFWRSLEGARFQGLVAARGSTSLRASEPAPAHALRVGDAAAAADPLSGSGVFWALASARAAVPVLETLVRRPERSELALRFFRERVAHHFAHQVELGRSFYAAEKRYAERPFFVRRRAALGAPSDAPGATSEVRVERRPVVEDGLIVEREVLVTREHPLGIWRVDGVPVVPRWRSANRDVANEATTVDDHPTDGTK